jgi:hypothetical protein
VPVAWNVTNWTGDGLLCFEPWIGLSEDPVCVLIVIMLLNGIIHGEF